MVSKSWIGAGFGALALLLAGGSPARALTLADVYSASAGNPASWQVLDVGNLQFSFYGCTSLTYCTSDIQIVGVPASPSTGAGGGIQLVGPVDQPILPANGEFTLKWYVDTLPYGSEIANITAFSGTVTGAVGQTDASAGTSIYRAANSYTTYTDLVGGTAFTQAINSGTQTLTISPNAYSVNAQMDLKSLGSPVTTVTQYFSTVPEPATLALLIPGLFVLAARRRRSA